MCFAFLVEHVLFHELAFSFGGFCGLRGGRGFWWLVWLWAGVCLRVGFAFDGQVLIRMYVFYSPFYCFSFMVVFL